MVHTGAAKTAPHVTGAGLILADQGVWRPACAVRANMPKATSKLAWSATTDEISSLEEMTAALRLEGEKLSRKMNVVKGSTGQTVIYQRAAGANMAPRTHARRVAAVWDEAEERAREEEAARVAAELEQMRLAAEDEAAREAEAEAKRERAEAVRAVGAERQRVAGLLYKEALQVSARARNSRARNAGPRNSAQFSR